MTTANSSHGSMRRLLAALVLIPILAACGSSAPTASPKPTATPSQAAPTAIGGSPSPSDSVPTLAPSDSPTPEPTGPVQQLACDPAGPGWPATALAKPADAETGTTDAAQALVAFIPTQTRSKLPKAGWRELYRSKTVALYGHPDASRPGAMTVVTVRNTGGTWAGAGTTQCQPHTWLGASLGIAADWTLVTKSTAASLTLKVAVKERACAGGASAKGRIAKPRISYEADRVVITIGVKPLPGKQSCTANPATNLTVTLSEALGDRQLYDGGPYPAASVAQPK
jgi:hypothetical protein